MDRPHVLVLGFLLSLLVQVSSLDLQENETLRVSPDEKGRKYILSNLHRS